MGNCQSASPSSAPLLCSVSASCLPPPPHRPIDHQTPPSHHSRSSDAPSTTPHASSSSSSHGHGQPPSSYACTAANAPALTELVPSSSPPVDAAPDSKRSADFVGFGDAEMMELEDEDALLQQVAMLLSRGHPPASFSIKGAAKSWLPELETIRE